MRGSQTDASKSINPTHFLRKVELCDAALLHAFAQANGAHERRQMARGANDCLVGDLGRRRILARNKGSSVDGLKLRKDVRVLFALSELWSQPLESDGLGRRLVLNLERKLVALAHFFVQMNLEGASVRLLFRTQPKGEQCPFPILDCRNQERFGVQKKRSGRRQRFERNRHGAREALVLKVQVEIKGQVLLSDRVAAGQTVGVCNDQLFRLLALILLGPLLLALILL